MRILYAISALLLTCTLAAPSAIAAQPKYAYQMVPLAGNGSSAAAINKAGAVVGQYTPTTPGNAGHAFLHSNGVLTDLGILPGDFRSAAAGINNKKQAVGGSFAFGPDIHAFLYSNGKMRDLGTGNGAFAYGINDAGDIVGSYRAAQGGAVGFLYRNGVIRTLNPLPGARGSGASAINQKGQVVGSSGAGLTVHAVLWENGNVKDLGTLGGSGSLGTDINDRGEVVGVSTVKRESPNPEFQGFIWSNGKMRKLGMLAGKAVFPLAINNRGDVVGYYGGNKTRAFLYTHHGQLYDLSSLVQPAQGRYVRIAYDINDAGQIAGEACDSAFRCVAVRLDPLTKWHGHAVTGEDEDMVLDQGDQQDEAGH